jgi:hypothetical protein
VLSGRGLCDEQITRPEEYYRLCCVVVCDLETSRIGALYIYIISNLKVNSPLGILIWTPSFSSIDQDTFNHAIVNHFFPVSCYVLWPPYPI